MEVKIISGYGENTFQMDDADTMSLLNNAMRFHNKIKLVSKLKRKRKSRKVSQHKNL